MEIKSDCVESYESQSEMDNLRTRAVIVAVNEYTKS